MRLRGIGAAIWVTIRIQAVAILANSPLTASSDTGNEYVAKSAGNRDWCTYLLAFQEFSESTMDASEPAKEEQASRYDHYGWVRRTDLALRTRYPHLQTRIFETFRNQYVIVFDKTILDATAIKEEFAEEIRFVTVYADVSNEAPANFFREIPTLQDDEIARGFAGIPFSLPALTNLIASRFPDLPVYAVRDGGNPMTITVELSSDVSDSDKDRVLKFCDDLKAPVPWQVTIVDAPTQEPRLPPRDPRLPPTIDNDPIGIRATRRRPGLPEFSRRDEAFWFDNLDNIFSGGIPVDAFPGVQQNSSQCFLDLTVGEHINLRQTLLLYDTVYISPPLLEGHAAFLGKQALSEEDLLHLIEVDRLKIVSTQAEERLNLSFLEAAAERNPTAILGRRTTAALLIADLVQTADEYQLAKPALVRSIGELAKLIGDQSKLSVRDAMHFLMWPIEARREALLPLLERGSKGIPTIGLGPFIARRFKEKTGKDIELEALVVSERVHIGHALNATVFPSRNEPSGFPALMNVIGDLLNFYRSLNTRIAASWIGNETRKAKRELAMPAFPLFEFEPGVPIREFLDEFCLPSTRNSGRALFGRLMELSGEEREHEVQRLEREMRARLGASDSFICFENFDTLIAIAGLLFGFPYPPVAGLRDIGTQLIEMARKNPSIDRIVSHMEAELFGKVGQNQEIDFLSRVSRVASFKKDRIS
jgi:hypothetical protein